MSNAPSSIMQRLKAETSDLHAHAESRALQQKIAVRIGQAAPIHIPKECVVFKDRHFQPAHLNSAIHAPVLNLFDEESVADAYLVVGVGLR